MPEIPVLGVPVNFPFTPYDSQKDFLTKVIEALQKNQNALLESPTGTGKTLCLLCASLAWLETHQARLQFQTSQSLASGYEIQRLDEQLKAGVVIEQLPPGFGNSRTRIIYASRTHTQLSQVMNELKRTSYSRFRTAIVASRDQLCIHPGVMKETSNQAKQAACRVKVQTRQCHFYNNVEKKKDLFALNNPNDSKSNILDIEDLKILGNKHKCCPYYISRSAAKDYADIIFMPYNYLIDPAIRKRHGIDLEGSVVIFDEAHNLAQVAEESSSVEITGLEIASALQELDAILGYLENLGKDQLENDNFAHGPDTDSLNFELLTLENVTKLKGVLIDLEKEIGNIELSQDRELKEGGRYLFELLGKVELGFNTYLPIYQIVDAAIGYLTSGGYSGIHSKAYGLGRFVNFLKVVFESDSYNIAQSPEMRKSHMASFYRVYIHEREPANKSYWSSASTANRPVRVLAFWCFSSGFSMMDLQKQGVRCIILASGTLKPLSSFSSELRIPFPITLENPHVISSNQISVAVVKQGPESVILNSNYQNRSNPRYHTSLGYAIMQIAKAVPNGMLVFFPSYTVMRSIIDSWNAGHIMQCIQRYKQLYIEPTNKEEFQLAMEQYYAMVNDATANGAIFCGVCRGKVSEGLDFVDKNGRAVVITGIPYAPAKDPRVVMKKSYLDQQLKDQSQKTVLTGTQWYNQQASRAVNQAIGRVIRHQFDYGAILLLDTRFASSYSREELPAWVNSHLEVHESFSSVIRMLNKFFKEVPAFVEARKAELQPAESPKPCGAPKISLNGEAALSSKLGLSASTVYSHTPAVPDMTVVKGGSSTALSSQPPKKKIKMQMVAGLVNRASSALEPACLSAFKEVSNETKENKLKLVSEALYKCRLLLSKEKFIGVKSSLLEYHRSKDISNMKQCISILLEQDTTHSVICRFRDVVSSKHRDKFEELLEQLESDRSHNLTDVSSIPSSSQLQSSQPLASQKKARYAATLSLFTECKKSLSPEQNKQVKIALLAYKNQGSVAELVLAIHKTVIENSRTFLEKLRGALRSADLTEYDRLIESESTCVGSLPTSAQFSSAASMYDCPLDTQSSSVSKVLEYGHSVSLKLQISGGPTDISNSTQIADQESLETCDNELL